MNSQIDRIKSLLVRMPYSRKTIFPAYRFKEYLKYKYYAANYPLLEHGSVTKGAEGWQQRWNDSLPRKRVLMIAPKDFAGSMYKLAEALNRHTEYAVRLITFEIHQYEYPVDLVVPGYDDKRFEKIIELASQSHILHLKDEYYWFAVCSLFNYRNKVQNRLLFSKDFDNHIKVYTHYGSYARKFKDNTKYIKRVRQFDSRIFFTPDLNYEWFNGEYIPHTIDTESIVNSWTDCNILTHSPSTISKKGTEILGSAIDRLNKMDILHNWQINIIHDVSYSECMRRKATSSLFFDQAGQHGKDGLGIKDVIGWYGNSAVEAMALGIPTIAHLSEIALQRAEKAGVDRSAIPILNIPRTVEGMADTIMSFAMLSSKERKILSERTRQFAVDFHGYKSVGKRMAEVYDKLIERK